MTNMFKKPFGSLTRASATGLLAVAAAMTSTPAKAAVNLSLTGTDGTSTSVALPHGGTFSVTLKLASTAETLTGVDYYFSVSGAASGKLTLIGRDMTGSPFNDPNLLNTGDNATNPGVLDSNFAVLNPQNALDLGATLTNVGTALPANTGSNPSSYLLGTYTFTLDPSTPAGNYQLTTTSFAGSGAVMQAPFFNEESFAQQGVFNIVVNPTVGTGVPEPTGMMALIGLGGLTLRRRRR